MVTVNTEYLLYDFISTLGNVGGTLGLFIGFSFSGLISYILNGAVKIVDFLKQWIGTNKAENKVTLVQETSHVIDKGVKTVLQLGIQSICCNDFLHLQNQMMLSRKCLKFK